MIQHHSFEAAFFDFDHVFACKSAAKASFFSYLVFFDKHFAADLVSCGENSGLEVPGWKSSDLVHCSNKYCRAVLFDLGHKGICFDSLICVYDKLGETLWICNFHAKGSLQSEGFEILRTHDCS